MLSSDSRALASAAVTAGFLNTDWSPRDVPSGTTTRNVALRTADDAATGGSLYVPAGRRPKTVVCVMHPREFMACHYLIPDIVSAGFAAWSQSPRSVGNDLRLEHEIALHDVAAGLAFLRGEGFEKIVLVGNSGGAGLFVLYAEQAALPAQARIERTPAGRPTGLDGLVMPAVDGLILLAPHPGQGALLLNCIDPSVVDENAPLEVDPALDPLSAANGFGGPGKTHYAQDFVARYRQGQRARVERIDAFARGLLSRRTQARGRVKAGGGESSVIDRREAAHSSIFSVWRTDADLRCFDLTLDPSERKFGSLWGKDPFASNFGSVGFARVCTPESWLSTWSAISSNAGLARTLASVASPVLLIEYTGDQACFPSDLRKIESMITSTDKQQFRVRGDHHGRALSAGEEAGRYIAGRHVQAWLRDRFAA
ncbi:MAG TPA: alpha/beta hydrolase [Ramlibacter sp.]|uniref:alpha/beta hydrolase n=1 Tax=Ramlibacter sp. TaxID=1917967 RepID=UPI002BF62331|nr:alpha/beta hydrolase [Ramlibacter sp.]HVZ46496.1 alpha/beta hydrolase [Ramlibacter sp.]